MFRRWLSFVGLSFWRMPVIVLCTAVFTACSNGEGPRTSNITVMEVGSSSASDPAVIIAGKDNRTVISYFGSKGGNPEQALLESDGLNIRVHYDPDGYPSRIVDVSTGNFVVPQIRADAVGVDYLFFDATGAFLNGYSVYKDGTDWYLAEVIGSLGQITGSLSGPPAGSFAMKAVSLVYGVPSRVPANLVPALEPVAPSMTAAFGRPFSGLVPTAHAASIRTKQSLPPGVGRVIRGTALTVVGGLVFNTPGFAPLGLVLIGAGVAQVGRGLQTYLNSELDPAMQAFDTGIGSSVTTALDTGTDPAPEVRSTIATVASNGLASLANRVTSGVNRVSGLVTGVVAAARSLGTGPAAEPLPTTYSGNSALTGTFVDTGNNVYPVSGVISQGNLTATSPVGNGIVQISGQLNPANGNVTGTTTLVSNGVPVGSGTITAQAGVVGTCASSARSGGSGTFSYAFNLGARSGTFSLSYQMYSNPDAMTVVVNGQVVFSTNGLVSGGAQQLLSFSGDNTAFVNISAPNFGTAWDFTIGCAG